jgi:hypothetical protein
MSEKETTTLTKANIKPIWSYVSVGVWYFSTRVKIVALRGPFLDLGTDPVPNLLRALLYRQQHAAPMRTGR